MNASETVEIVRIGHGGDGVTADGVFVPFTVPGDVVRILRDGERARLEEIVRPGPARAKPSCPHFGRCGGCALQQVAPGPYLAWKREQVMAALAQRGFRDVEVEEIRAVAPGTRRRAQFKARGVSGGAELGFYEAGSRILVDLATCPVLVPELANLLAPLRAEFAALLAPGETAEAHVTATDTGVDLALTWKRVETPDLFAKLAAAARRLKLARLLWNGEPVSIAAPPALSIGRFTVALPPEPFLQPSSEGERILQSLVVEGVGEAKRVADLFCGVGTFALALADGRTIRAVDSGATMLAALSDAARRGGAKVEIERRDLFRRPLMPPELSRFDAVVIDPPRPGAKAQAQQLAASAVPRLVYVSCNVASFARDATYLREGHYRLRRVVPVDQFLWSPHVELVGVFERT